jgi:hypothetical protein
MGEVSLVRVVSREVSVNKTLECERKVVVDVRCGVHGMKRGGVKGVREEDSRHHVTVELRLAWPILTVQLLVHVSEVE